MKSIIVRLLAILGWPFLSRSGRWLTCFLLLALMVAIQYVTNGLIKPNRRPLHASYQAILDHAKEAGLEISHESTRAPDGCLLAYLVVKRAAQVGAPPVIDASYHQALSPSFREVPPGSRGFVYLLHGFRNRKEQWLPVARQLAWTGFTCILADSRAHGESDGVFATFGVKEAADVKLVWEEVKAKHVGNNQELSLVGYSMGGAIALRALDEMPDVRRVVTLSTFDKLERVMRDQAQSTYGLLTRPLMLAVCASAKIRAGINPLTVCPAYCAARHAVPLLVIHGAEDTFVSPEASAALEAAAKGPCRRIVVPQKNHWSLFYDRDPMIHAEIAKFLRGG